MRLPCPRRAEIRARAFLILAALFTVLLAGCTSTDAVRAAQRAFDRALAIEPTSAFFGPVLARARGESAVAAVPAQARQHYLSVIAEMELLSPTGKENLRREGLLGSAYALKLLAQWRLGRLDQARTSLREGRAANQESLNARDRTLVAAFEGVAQLESAIAALAAKQPYENIFNLIAGDSGAWRALGTARMQSARVGPPPPELLEARLAAFKILKDARDLVPANAPLSPALNEAWLRLRAEAQIELEQFSALTVSDAAAHAAKVRQWQVACGLDAPVR